VEMQKIIWDDILNGLQSEVLEKRMSGVLLICGKRMRETDIGRRLRKMPFVVAVFSDFEPNPTYEAVLQALNMFEKNRCDAIMALGGGSAIDIAKCVKAFYGMDGSVNFLNQNILPNKIPLVAVPSTAGTGSEATSFAVIYFEGIKYSVADASLMPGLVLMEASLLRTLPAYQKKVTMLDAFCHCVESYWSNNATRDSKKYAADGLRYIMGNYKAYLEGDESAAKNMLLASNFAGRAINIAKTTAAHAMCYQMTKLYGFPHGHAAALCLAGVWKYTWRGADIQGNRAVLGCLRELAHCLGCGTIEESIEFYIKFLKELGITFDAECGQDDIGALAGSVNEERLKNHPVLFQKKEIQEMYAEIMGGAYEGK